jgi:hypothetical protein
MTFVLRVRHCATAIATAAMVAIASPSLAQEITESHLKAARAAVDAINATDFYDDILPNAAAALKRELIQKNPDLTSEITTIVDTKALELASRRTDLERESATAYARVLSEADLNAIAAFYTSPAGLNLLKEGPIVTREVAKAAEIWQNGVARDLAEAVAKDMQTKIGTPNEGPGLTGTAVPGDPAQPAPQGGATSN